MKQALIAFIQRLSDPEALKIIVPVFVGLIAALVGFASAFTVAITSHFLNKRAEVNKLRLSKGYALAEKIAESLQRLEERCRYFEEFWKSNYGHVDDFHKCIENFETKGQLFENDYKVIQQHRKERQDLSSLLLGAWVYLPDKLVKSTRDYLAVGEFSFVTDNIGLVNDYHTKFFENLLNKENQKNRKNHYEKTVKLLKKLKL